MSIVPPPKIFYSIALFISRLWYILYAKIRDKSRRAASFKAKDICGRNVEDEVAMDSATVNLRLPESFIELKIIDNN